METCFHCSFLRSVSELVIQSNFIYHRLQNGLNGCLRISIQCEIAEIRNNWYCGTNEIYIYMHIHICVVLYITSVYIIYMCIWLCIYTEILNTSPFNLPWKNINHEKKKKKREKNVLIVFDNAAKFCWKFHTQKLNACRNLQFFFRKLSISLHSAVLCKWIPIMDFNLIKVL